MSGNYKRVLVNSSNKYIILVYLTWITTVSKEVERQIYYNNTAGLSTHFLLNLFYLLMFIINSWLFEIRHGHPISCKIFISNFDYFKNIFIHLIRERYMIGFEITLQKQCWCKYLRILMVQPECLSHILLSCTTGNRLERDSHR